MKYITEYINIIILFIYIYTSIQNKSIIKNGENKTTQPAICLLSELQYKT